MCGLFGFVGKPNRETVKIFRYLGFLNESRGKDSTGFCAYTKDDLSFMKDVEKSTSFLSRFENTKTLLNYSNKPSLILMGHTRQATIGAVTKKNAHPFQIGKIIMSHNGHINNFEELKKKSKLKYEVDSQIIGHLLATENEKEAFKKLEGWYTVSYINIEQENMLNIATSNGMFTYAMKKDQLYYSSSETDLKDALKDEKGFDFYSGERDELYRIYLLNDYIIVSQEKIEASESFILTGEICSVITKNLKNITKAL